MTYFRRDITHNASNGRGTNVLKSSLATVYGCATRSQGVSVTFGTPSVSYAYTDSGRLSSAVLSDGTAFAYFYHPALMRWLNRDPIGESGDSNQYLFVRNIPLQKVDAKGLYWQIKRNGGIFAYATPTENNDTFEILARKLRLDMIDYKIWAHTSDVKPHRCKKYKIPNLVVYDSGGRRFVDKLPLNVINIWRWQNEKRAASDCRV